MIRQDEVRGRVVRVLLRVGLEVPELVGVDARVAVEAAHRRPVPAGCDGQQGVEHGGGRAVVAEGEEGQGVELVEDRVVGGEAEGLLDEVAGLAVVVGGEGGAGLLEELVGLLTLGGLGRRGVGVGLAAGGVDRRRRGRGVVDDDRLGVVVDRGASDRSGVVGVDVGPAVIARGPRPERPERPAGGPVGEREVPGVGPGARPAPVVPAAIAAPDVAPGIRIPVAVPVVAAAPVTDAADAADAPAGTTAADDVRPVSGCCRSRC